MWMARRPGGMSYRSRSIRTPLGPSMRDALPTSLPSRSIKLAEACIWSSAWAVPAVNPSAAAIATAEILFIVVSSNRLKLPCLDADSAVDVVSDYRFSLSQHSREWLRSESGLGLPCIMSAGLIKGTLRHEHQ